MATKAGGAYIEVRGDSSKLTGDLTAAHQKIEAASLKMQQTMTRLLKVGMAAGVAAVSAAAAISVKQFAEWEVALNRLGNVSDRSLGSMRKDILGMSSELGSVTELTKGYYQVLSAGITDAGKSMEMLTVSAKMSKEATIAQGEAVRGLASVMSTYSDELKTATDAADLLYMIEAKGITSVGELIPYIGRLANMSKMAGLSVDEMAASLAAITQSGAGTAVSVTQMIALLNNLNTKWKELPESIQKYGTVAAAVKALKFEGVLKEIANATDGNQAAMKRMMESVEAQGAMFQLTKNNFAAYEDGLQGMINKTGAFDDAWKRYAKTLSAIWDTFKNTVGRQAVLLGEKLAKPLKDIVERVSAWAQQNDKLIEQKTFEAIDKIKESVKGIVEIYNALPDGVVGAAGTGLLIRMLTGSTPIGTLAATLYVINTQLDKMTGHVSAMSASLKVVTGLLLHSAFGGFLKWAGRARVAIFALGKLSFYVAMVDGIARVYTAWTRMSKFVTETPATWGAAMRLAAENVVNSVINSFVALGNLMPNVVGIVLDPLIAAFTSFNIVDLLFGDLTKEQAWESITSSMESAFKNALQRVGKDFHADMSQRIIQIASDADRELLANWTKSDGSTSTTPKASVPITGHLDEKSVEENIKKFFEDRKSDLSNLFEIPKFTAKTEIEFEVDSTPFIQAYNEIEAVKQSAMEMAEKIKTVYGEDVSKAYIQNVISAYQEEMSIWKEYSQKYQIILLGETEFKRQQYQKDLEIYLEVEVKKGKITQEEAEKRSKIMLDAFDKENREISQLEEFWNHTLENMYDTTADFWYNILDGVENTFDSIKTWFKKLIAQLLAMASTPIVLNIIVTTAGSLGMTSVANAATEMAGKLGVGGVAATGTSSTSGWSIGSILPNMKAYTAETGANAAMYLFGEEAGSAVGNTIMEMSNSAFAGWAAGITTFVVDLLSGQALEEAAVHATTTGLGGWGGATIGTMILQGIGTAIGAVIGSFVGSTAGNWLAGLFGGGGEHEFTLTEMIRDEVNDTVFDAVSGFETRGYSIPAGAGNAWYHPIANAYAAVIETIQQSFNEYVFYLTDTLPEEMSNQILSELAATDFAALLSGVSGGRWGISSAQSVIEGIAESYATALSETLATAYSNAFSDYISTQGAEGLLGDTKVWGLLTDRVQNNIEYMYQQIAEQIKEGDLEGGIEALDEISTVITNIASALEPITEIIETADLSDYETSLRTINKEFEDYGEALETAGIDLAKYTDFFDAWTISIQKLNEETWEGIKSEIESLNGLTDTSEAKLASLNAQFQGYIDTLLEMSGVPFSSMDDFAGKIEQLEAFLALSTSDQENALQQMLERPYFIGGKQANWIADLSQAQIDAIYENYDNLMWVYEQWEIATDNLGDELKNELTEAREKIVDLWSDVIESLQGQIDSMIFSTDNQADAAERLALMQDKIFGMTGGDISTYIAGFGTASEKVGAVEELQGFLSNYLSLAQETFQRPSNEYAAIYEDVLSQLTELQNISTGYRTQEQVLLDQLGVLTDIRDLIAEESLLGGYATGTSYVPETGPYMLHRGEAVVPANRNYDSPAVKNEVSFKIEINGATNPGATGKAVRKELESFMRSPVGRKLIQTTSAGKA